MKKKNSLIIVICCLVWVRAAFAQTVSWQKKPQWNTVEWLSEGLLRVKQNGKWGIVQIDGTQIAACNYSQITRFNEGHFLVLDENHRISYIGDETGKMIFVGGKTWYADSSWPCFTDGLLAVKGENGLWGYMDYSGTLVIKNKYKNAFPFFYGQAAVCFHNGVFNKDIWLHIDTKERKLTINDKKLQSIDAVFASSFTQIGEQFLAIVILENHQLYMIDVFGRLQDAPINKEGALFVGKNGKVLVCNQNNTSVDIEVNSVIEMVSIKVGEKVYGCQAKTSGNDGIAFPNIQDIELTKSGVLEINQLKIASQYQEVIPVSSDYILVKKNGLWGIIRINRMQPAVTITSMQKGIIRLDHHASIKSPVELSRISSDVKVFAVGRSGEKTYVDYDENARAFLVPLEVEEGCLRARIGLEMDGILLEPETFSVPVIWSDGFEVRGPSSAIVVNDRGYASFQIRISNKSRQASAPIDVIVNGKTHHFNEIEQGQSVNVHVDMRINLGVKDELKKNIRVIIREKELPEKEYPINVKFTAPIIQEQ